jgi:adenine-specific DNA glycosylase
VHEAGVAALLAWGARHRRDLPWRRSRDPWAVLVSELMLQQTQVARVVARYEEFLAELPDPAACAAASAGDVVLAWAGLGYNRRAVNLHRAARAIVDRHNGEVPDSLPDLVALPGVGPYTARAVLVFAFDRDVGLVDTNAGRFVSRALAVGPSAVARRRRWRTRRYRRVERGRGGRRCSISARSSARGASPRAGAARSRRGARGKWMGVRRPTR